LAGGSPNLVSEFPCLNCDRAVENPGELFCSDLCREMAKVIRYGRAVHADRRIKQPDVAEALRIKVGIVVGGGYPQRERRLGDDQRQQIFERDDGMCRDCGAPATEIDHIGPPIDGDINHPDNLQALCNQCHRAKTLSRFRPIESEEERHRSLEINARIHAPEPLRICDAGDWKGRWPMLKAERLEQAGR
jgi:5-methylcytosine-specific restriction endonuclease McrA